MHTPRPAVFRTRQGAALPFLLVALLAVLAGGIVAAVVAHAPSRALVWMVAYLVLVVGVAQAAFGAGQAWLATGELSVRLVAWECAVFNLANLGVIAGTLVACVALVAVGTLVFVVALLMFLAGVRHARRSRGLIAYRIALGALALSSSIGLGLSLLRAVA